MAFALAVNNLIEAMQKPGCPACRIFRQASARALESFLWENVNEPDVRQGILDSYGFCPTHTRVMVAREVMTSSIPLGTNIIYEHLGRVVAGELKHQRPGNAGVSAGAAARDLLNRLGVRKAGSSPMMARGVCPACQAGENAATNSLHVLCEELEKDGDVRQTYLAGDGLCLAHLRAAIGAHSQAFPKSVTLLIDDTVTRLEDQSRNMKEYIRKNNWSYRGETLSESEDTAWRKTLGFFTGYAGSSFTHKTDEE
jgi:hypothetical protein